LNSTPIGQCGPGDTGKVNHGTNRKTGLECVVLKKIAKKQCGLGPEKGGFRIGGDEEE
jgi:hypothetical protein